MKKSLFYFLLVFQLATAGEKGNFSGRFSQFSLVSEAEDCDACSCSSTGGSMGFSSVFNNNFVGVRYFYQSYTSKDGIFDNSPHVDENFNTAQIWARIAVSKKIQLSALVPYHFHTREKTSGNENISGLGDVTLLGMYNVYETEKTA